MYNQEDINWEEVYVSYQDKVLAYLKNRMGDIQEAEDLQSEVFLKVLQKKDKFDPGKASVSTWIFTITHNTLIDYYRTRKVMQEVPETLAEDYSIDDGILQQERLEELAVALEKLEVRERDLIILRYYQENTLKYAAQMMGMSYANAKIVHKKALKKLQGILQKKE